MTRNDDLQQPFAQWEEVEVQFPATADTDIAIPHSLRPTDPEALNYLVVRCAPAATIYHDAGAARKLWTPGILHLRATTAAARVRLLLYISHQGQVPLF